MQNNQPFVHKDELLRRLERGHQTFASWLDQLSDTQVTARNVVGSWSVQDVLAHFIAHEQRTLQELQYALRGERLEIDHGDMDRFNEESVSRWRAHAYTEVREFWEVTGRQIVATVSDLSDSDFEPSSAVVKALGDTIDGALANNTYEHYAEHLRELEVAFSGD